MSTSYKVILYIEREYTRVRYLSILYLVRLCKCIFYVAQQMHQAFPWHHSLDPCTDKEAMRNQKSDYLVRRTLLAVYEDLIGCCIRLHPYVMMDSRVPSRIPVMESAKGR